MIIILIIIIIIIIIIIKTIIKTESSHKPGIIEILHGLKGETE